MTIGPFIAVDWGTSNRRVFVIERDAVVAVERDAKGAAHMSSADYPAEVAALRARYGDVPVLVSGMAGSNIGWRTAPYVAAPAGLEQLAAALLRIDAWTALLPGLSVTDGAHADVMRGEEVQFLGAAVTGLIPADALACQPGTHSKWAQLSRGSVARFTTAMTGELFALLRGNSLIAGQIAGDVVAGDAFRRGVREGAHRDIAASLFGVRARGLLGLLPVADAPAYASGVLIGAEVAARIAPGETVHVIAGPVLGGLYADAVAELGGTAVQIDSEAAFVAGASRLAEIVF